MSVRDRRGDGNDIVHMLIKIEGRLSSLEARMDALEKWMHETREETNRRLTAIEEKLEELARSHHTTSTNNMRWLVIILAMILSFLAAVLGLRWWPGFLGVD